MQNNEFASSADGTKHDSSANKPASADHLLTTHCAAPPSSFLREKIAARRLAQYGATAWTPRDATDAEWLRGVRGSTPSSIKWRAEPKAQVVYFIQAAGGAIKIGISHNVNSRLNTLQTAHHEHLSLVATVDGGALLESEYHAKFSEHRLQGEWFLPHPDILAEIDRLQGETA